MPECEFHKVDFDKLEVVHLKRRGHILLRAQCGKCKTAVSLDDVLASLAAKVYNLNERLLAFEKEKKDVQPVSGSDS